MSRYILPRPSHITAPPHDEIAEVEASASFTFDSYVLVVEHNDLTRLPESLAAL